MVVADDRSLYVGFVGLATKPTLHEDPRGGDGIRLHRKALRQGTCNVIVGFVLRRCKCAVEACPLNGDTHKLPKMPRSGLYLPFKL
jgi:hypothetical protein